MGEVYRAVDTKLRREVAIKVLPPGVGADEDRLARFEREARLLASLNHPNIAQIYGLEEVAEAPALIMELVEGQTLSERMWSAESSGPSRARELSPSIPLEEALEIGEQIAAALEEAHSKGIIHRDLKPANVKLSERGRVKVLDFGLAKALDAPASDPELAATFSVGATQPGMIVGTAAYMAPEQARGTKVDRRADVWSFGVVLYEMLVGEPLFSAPTLADTLSAVLNRKIDLGRLPRSLPPSLKELVAHCLERDPQKRLEELGEVRRCLQDLRAASIARASLTLAAPGAMTIFPSVAVLPFVNMSADADNAFFADGITEDVIAHLAKVRTLRVTSRTSSMAFKGGKRTLQEIGTLLKVSAIVEGSVRRYENRVRIVAQLFDLSSNAHLWAETYDRDLNDIFAIQTDVALQIASALHAELTADEESRIGLRPTRDVEAYDLYLQGREHLARLTREGVTRSVAFFERALERDPGFALAHAAIAHAYTRFGIEGIRGIEPVAAFCTAQEAVERALELDPGLAEAHGIVGLLRFTRDYDWKGAESELRLALKLSPNNADLHDHLGWLCSSQRRFQESLALVRRARELDPLAHRGDVANELMRAGRTREALAEAEEALAADPGSSRYHSLFGWACLSLGREAEGIRSLERAVEFSPDSTLFRAQLGQAYGMTGQVAKAREILEELEALSMTQIVADYHIAHIHTGLGDQEAAIDCLERACERRSGGVSGIQGSFLFAPLREHPRFQALLRKMNL